jgi:hypothetical protein
MSKLIQGAIADMYHAGTDSFYQVQVLKPIEGKLTPEARVKELEEDAENWRRWDDAAGRDGRTEAQDGPRLRAGDDAPVGQ